ncbi:hypothetical protein [Bordetella sp. LUAb4]|uniref:hypothetical protein n=1 Tax=Bordetella sp. LUAb4 TaxID=2843195 RepID=UPI001E60F113|nr:hypothetical protein [Bordetella sp. LUAb4]
MIAPSFPLQTMPAATSAGAAPEDDSGSDSAIEMSRQGSSRAANHARFDSGADHALPSATASPSRSRRASSDVSMGSNPDTARDQRANPGTVPSTTPYATQDATRHSETASVSTQGWQFDEVNLENPPPYSVQDPARLECAEPPDQDPDEPPATDGQCCGMQPRNRVKVLWGAGAALGSAAIILGFAPLFAPDLGASMTVSPWLCAMLSVASLIMFVRACQAGRVQQH